MTKEEAKYFSNVLKVYSEGGVIEYLGADGEWKYIGKNPTFTRGPMRYRIKSKPKYRPYKNAEEFLQAQKEHGLYVQLKDSDVYYLPTIVSLGILFNNQFPYELEVMLGKEVTKAIELLEKFQWQDGHPTGILEE